MLSDLETGAALAAMQASGDKKVERLLLLGATGNVGQHVLSWLLEDASARDSEVRLLVGTRQPDTFWTGYRHPRRCPAVVEPVQVDLGNSASVAAAVAAARPDRVFMCLPQALGAAAMEEAGRACVDAAVAAGTARLVRVSSVGIDVGEGQGPLGTAHLAVEAYAAEKGLGLSSVRDRPRARRFLHPLRAIPAGHAAARMRMVVRWVSVIVVALCRSDRPRSTPTLRSTTPPAYGQRAASGTWPTPCCCPAAARCCPTAILRCCCPATLLLSCCAVLLPAVL